MVIQLFVQFGPQAFEMVKTLIAKWGSTDPVTIADIDMLRKLGTRSPKDAVIESLLRANIPLDSPEATALLALVPV